MNKYYCSYCGIWCEHATEYGSCRNTVCTRPPKDITEVSPKFMPDEIEINGVIYVRKTEFANDKED